MKLAVIIPFAIVAVTLVACGKDKFKTNPQIEIKSVNKKTVGRNETLTVKLKFTDKEGDIADGFFVYIPKRLNSRPLPPTIPDYDSVKLLVPHFPDETQGEYDLQLPWLFLHKSYTENDSIILRFVAVDRGNNKSDTVSSSRIVILKN